MKDKVQAAHQVGAAQATRDAIINEQIKADPSPATYNSAGLAKLSDGDYRQAHDYVDRAKTLAASDPSKLAPLYDTSARIYFEERNYAQAAKEAKHALAIKPKDPVALALFKLSQAHNIPKKAPSVGSLDAQAKAHEQEAQVSAEAFAQRTTQGAPAASAQKHRESLKRAQQALAALTIGDPLKALKLANSAIKSDPACPEAYRARAMAEKELAQLRAAVTDATTAIGLWTSEKALSPEAQQKLAATYALRARACEILHEDAEAVLADLREAARLDPIYAPELKARLSLAGQAPSAPAAASWLSDRPIGRHPWLWLGAIVSLLVAYILLRRRRESAGL